jgi:hypothetical protein
MTYTTISAAFEGGFVSDENFRGGWGSGPFVWDNLADRYNIEGGMFERWKNLATYHETNALEPFEHNTLVTTYDWHVVKRDDMLTIARSFECFVAAYPPGDRACTLLEQAKAIRGRYAEGAEFLAWNQTSVSDPWFEIRDEESDDRTYYDPHHQNEHTVATVKPLPDLGQTP